MASLQLIASDLLAEARMKKGDHVGASRTWREWYVQVSIISCVDKGGHNHVHVSTRLRDGIIVPEDENKATENFMKVLSALGCPDPAACFVTHTTDRMHFNWREDGRTEPCKAEA